MSKQFLSGTHADRPAASASNAGYYYTETNTPEPCLFQSDGSTWQPAAYRPAAIVTPQPGSFLGYNTVGASIVAVTSSTIAKTITTTTAGFLMSVDIHCGSASTANYHNLLVGVWDDNSGVPLNVLARGGNSNNEIKLDATYRWLATPVGVYLPTPGTYWIGFCVLDGKGGLNVKYDAGHDVTWSPSFAEINDGDKYSQSDSSKKFSLRASFLPA